MQLAKTCGLAVLLVGGGLSSCGSSATTPGSVTAGDGGSPASDAAGSQAAPHMVTACPGVDGGGDAVGEWVDVTPPMVNIDPNYGGFNTGVVAFVIDPSNTSTLYLGTHGQGVWKTTDCGASWTLVNTGTLGKEIGSGRNWTMAIDPVDPEVLYANSGYGPGGLFKSTNGGVDWANLLGAGTIFDKDVVADFVEFVALDPTDHQHLLVSSHANCLNEVEGPTCFAESTDGGQTWKMIKVAGMGYEGTGHVLLDRTTWINFQPGASVEVTQNSGGTWVSSGSDASNQAGELYKHNDGYYYAAGSFGVQRSHDGLTWQGVPNSPKSYSLAGDGDTMFTSWHDTTPTLYWTSTDGKTWTKYSQPPNLKVGAWLMRYDRDHSLLYTSNNTGGFWRVKTK